MAFPFPPRRLCFFNGIFLAPAGPVAALYDFQRVGDTTLYAVDEFVRRGGSPATLVDRSRAPAPNATKRSCLLVFGERLTPAKRPNMSSIQIEGVTKNYGLVCALSGVSLDFPKGKCLGVVGPNGAGKSTLVKIVCGAVYPDGGRVLLDGRDVGKEPDAAKARFGCALEDPALFDLLTGREQLQWMGEVYGLSGKIISERVSELARVLELTGVLAKPISTYSKGTRKKLGFAGAVLGAPRILVLDEPFEGVDVVGVHAIKNILRQFCECGTCILVTSHLLAILEDSCDLFALIHEGRILFNGDRYVLRDRAEKIIKREATTPDLEAVFLDIVAPEHRTYRLEMLASVRTAILRGQ